MEKEYRIVKFAYLFGAVVDAIWVVLLGFPNLYIKFTQSSNLELSSNVRMVFTIAASLMLSWTLLLLWGNRKPIERSFILLLTAFPLVSGIFLGTIMSFLNGNSLTILFSIKTAVVIFVMILGYINAIKIIKHEKNENYKHYKH